MKLKTILYLSLFTLPTLLYSSILRVPSQYSNIQSAVISAGPGDLILVSDGTYNENIEINNNLSKNFIYHLLLLIAALGRILLSSNAPNELFNKYCMN